MRREREGVKDRDRQTDREREIERERERGRYRQWSGREVEPITPVMFECWVMGRLSCQNHSPQQQH